MGGSMSSSPSSLTSSSSMNRHSLRSISSTASSPQPPPISSTRNSGVLSAWNRNTRSGNPYLYRESRNGNDYGDEYDEDASPSFEENVQPLSRKQQLFLQGWNFTKRTAATISQQLNSTTSAAKCHYSRDYDNDLYARQVEITTKRWERLGLDESENFSRKLLPPPHLNLPSKGSKTRVECCNIGEMLPPPPPYEPKQRGVDQMFDSNQNYQMRNGFFRKNGVITSANLRKSSASKIRNHFANFNTKLTREGENGRDTTIISNAHTIDQEMKRDLKLAKLDIANNNVEPSPDGPRARTPLSPKHKPATISRLFTSFGERRRQNPVVDNSKHRSSFGGVAIIPFSSNNNNGRPVSWAVNSPSPSCQSPQDLTIGESIVDGQGNKKTVIQASTSELLRGLGNYIEMMLPQVGQFAAAHLVMWLRSVDRALMVQGWQDVAFINPANLVFVYMLIRERLRSPDGCDTEASGLSTVEDVQSIVLTCLYISYSYMGNEISYPLKPFITDSADRGEFWARCVSIINAHSGEMLRLNASSSYFLEVFSELKEYSIDPE